MVAISSLVGGLNHRKITAFTQQLTNFHAPNRIRRCYHRYKR